MNRKSSTTLTISAVAFIAALLIDLYLILVYPSMIQVIIAVSLIVVVDTYFLVDGILAKVDEIANLNLDKQNELTKVQTCHINQENADAHSCQKIILGAIAQNTFLRFFVHMGTIVAGNLFWACFLDHIAKYIIIYHSEPCGKNLGSIQKI